jgi:putative tricarboxylic transport membrane protein
VLSRGNMAVFIERPISAVFIGICTLLVLVQLGFWLRRVGMKKVIVVHNPPECAMEDA